MLAINGQSRASSLLQESVGRGDYLRVEKLNESGTWIIMDDRQLERLKWRSRRGLLELDLLFTRFWQQSASRLNETDMRALDRLLQFPDNDILDMVMARQACTDAQITPVIHQLQQL